MPPASDFAAVYREMSDDQLLQLADDGGLVDEAQVALTSEMSRRKLIGEPSRKFSLEKQRQRGQKTRDDKSKYPVGTNGWGNGYEVYGRAYLSPEDKTLNIQVRTTWRVLRHTPLYPVASYRYQIHEIQHGKKTFKSEKKLDQVPIPVRQVLLTYLQMAGWLILGSVIMWGLDRTGILRHLDNHQLHH